MGCNVLARRAVLATQPPTRMAASPPARRRQTAARKQYWPIRRASN